MLHSLK